MGVVDDVVRDLKCALRFEKSNEGNGVFQTFKDAVSNDEEKCPS